MPELPEVETVVRLVRPRLEGRRIRGAAVFWARSLGGTPPEDFARAVRGTRIARVWRRAKFVLMELQRRGRPAGFLATHLRMSGRLYVRTASVRRDPHVRVTLALDGGRSLDFVDVRKFGRLLYLSALEPLLGPLGPEPLGPSFTVRWLQAALGGRRRQLKPLLLDQTFIAGLGNIYVDESLHAAGLHPLRRADGLDPAAVRALHGAVRRILRAAIRREGSSFDTFYRTPEGRPGRYQEQFRVYGRGGHPCPRCGTVVRRIVVGQRGTHVCPLCQPIPRRSTYSGRRAPRSSVGRKPVTR